MVDGGNTTPRIDKSEHIGLNDTGDNIEAKRVATYEALDGVNWSRSGTQLTVRIDDSTTANTTYIGKAVIASASSGAVWQVAKLDTSSGLVKTWADGNALFDNIWDNRASLTYN